MARSGGRGAHSPADLDAILGFQVAVGPVDGIVHLRGKILLHDPAADVRTSRLQGRNVGHVQPLQALRDTLIKTVLRKEFPVGFRGRGKTAGDRNAQRRQVLQHLAQRGILATYLTDVLHAESMQGNDVFIHLEVPVHGEA